MNSKEALNIIFSAKIRRTKTGYLVSENFIVSVQSLINNGACGQCFCYDAEKGCTCPDKDLWYYCKGKI